MSNVINMFTRKPVESEETKQEKIAASIRRIQKLLASIHSEGIEEARESLDYARQVKPLRE